MIKSATVEKTTKYSLTKAELEKLILHEINPAMDDGIASHVSVKFEYSISGCTMVTPTITAIAHVGNPTYSVV